MGAGWDLLHTSSLCSPSLPPGWPGLPETGAYLAVFYTGSDFFCLTKDLHMSIGLPLKRVDAEAKVTGSARLDALKAMLAGNKG